MFSRRATKRGVGSFYGQAQVTGVVGGGCRPKPSGWMTDWSQVWTNASYILSSHSLELCKSPPLIFCKGKGPPLISTPTRARWFERNFSERKNLLTRNRNKLLGLYGKPWGGSLYPPRTSPWWQNFCQQGKNVSLSWFLFFPWGRMLDTWPNLHQ